MLRSEIFMHWDGQLQASHLILGINPVYSTWQAFGQALLVDSPFLSYIDVRHANFLPPRLTVGDTRDLGPRYTCLNELAPIKDESAEHVSRCRREQACSLSNKPLSKKNLRLLLRQKRQQLNQSVLQKPNPKW